MYNNSVVSNSLITQTFFIENPPPEVIALSITNGGIFMPTGIYKHKSCSEETKLKISKSNTGKRRTEEQKIRMLKTKKGAGYDQDCKQVKFAKCYI